MGSTGYYGLLGVTGVIGSTGCYGPLGVIGC